MKHVHQFPFRSLAVRDAQDLLRYGPPVLLIPDAREQVREANAASDTWVVVLDDDPTGSQSVQDIAVLASWGPEDVRWAFSRPTRMFFVLTNTRSMGADDARQTVESVMRTVHEIADDLGVRFVVLSRGDSTMRGHFLTETTALEELARSFGAPYDALLIVPAYLDAGRVTADDVHYVRSGEVFVPVGQTEYARDATFGFESSNLRDYVEEKTERRVLARDVVGLSLDDIRLGGVQRVCDVLTSCHDAQAVVVNAIDGADLDVVALGLVRAREQGVRVLCRTGPSFVPACAGLSERGPLGYKEIFPADARRGHGLIVVGSHVELTTRQVHAVMELVNVVTVEVEVLRLLDLTLMQQEVERCIAAATASLLTSETVLMSSRIEITGGTTRENLLVAKQVSEALVTITRAVIASVEVAWVVAKGGITSSDIATKALNIRWATVLGQLFPGIVSVWVHEGGVRDDLKGLPYVVFAGNVGDSSTLAKTVLLLRGEY